MEEKAEIVLKMIEYILVCPPPPCYNEKEVPRKGAA